MHKASIAAWILIAVAVDTGLASAAELRVGTGETYATIQAALTAALPGDTVTVTAGTYFENRLTFDGKDVELVSESGAASTIIDGGDTDIVFYLRFGTTRAAIIDGFTIQNGFGDLPSKEPGAVFIVDSSPTLRNNIFRDNTTDAAGGAIVIAGTTPGAAFPLIQDNQFIDNQANQDGGAMQLFEATAELIGNTFTGNTTLGIGSNGAGGALLAAACPSPTCQAMVITDNVFQMNTAISTDGTTAAGGGVSIFGTSGNLTGNAFLMNDGGEFGGAIHVESNGVYGSQSWVIHDNVIDGNVATDKGGGIHPFSNDSIAVTIDITDNTIVNNSVHSMTGFGQGGGIGQIAIGAQSTVTVTGNTIMGNSADLFGGASFTTLDTLTFEDNVVEANTAMDGYPGLYLEAITNARVARNSFIANQVDRMTATVALGGGGVRVRDMLGDVTIENNLFSGNGGVNAGAIGLVSPNTTTYIVGNTIVDNDVDGAPGFGSLWLQTDAVVSNNIIAGSDSDGIRIKDDPLVTLTANDFYQNAAAAVRDPLNALMTPSPPPFYPTGAAVNASPNASGNLDLDPTFVDEMNGDYHLDGLSGLVDMGSCTDFDVLDDREGMARPVGSDCDIGAYELPAPAVGAMQLASALALLLLRRATRD